MSGPLAGYRVIDVTQMLSGPMATMMLGDQGADVIKVEPPDTGDLTRALGGKSRPISPFFSTLNRNKRSVVLNLKDEKGVGLLKDLVADADVFVQNFRPGIAERMGIGEDVLRQVKPDLIYVSISGFGEKGPYVGKRVYDPVIQALSGLADIQADPDYWPAAYDTAHHSRQGHGSDCGPSHYRRPPGPGTNRGGAACPPRHAGRGRLVSVA